jgi:hypothetical protein
MPQAVKTLWVAEWWSISPRWKWTKTKNRTDTTLAKQKA